MSGLSQNWKIGIAIAIIALMGIGYFMFFRGGNKATVEPTPTPEQTVEEPTPTEVPAIDKKDIKIRILNGSGVVGEAGRVKAILEKAGFTVESTANADSYDHKETEIKAKGAIPSAVLDELKKLLNEYTVTTSTLEDSEEINIILTVGARKNPPTPAAKPSPTSVKTVTPTIGSQTPTPTSQQTPTPTPTKTP